MTTSAQAALAKKPDHCLARQPILTKDEKVIGYELLFREAADENRFSSDVESATLTTINTLNLMGLNVVCDGRTAFINCSQQVLLKEYFLLLPADKVVVEIQENVLADEATLAACRRLKQKGYKIALDNFSPNDPRQVLIPLADFIKIDIRESPKGIGAIAGVGKHCQMLAQKVETREYFINAAKSGFTLFQGYFFRRPEKMRARDLPANHASHLRLLKVISAPEVDFDAVEDLIKHDASLCYRLLRYLNSPILGLSSTVQSIRHAMALLGERELVRWIRMVTTLVMGHEKCSDLVLSSLVRARFCELAAPKMDHGSSDAFLMGMLSLMDAILEMPMGMVVDGLALDAETKECLLGLKTGKKTHLSELHQLMLAREIGEWEDVTAHAKKLNLSLVFVNRSYNEAMNWAHEMTAGVLQNNV